MVWSVGVGARSARLLRCGTGCLRSTRLVQSFPVVKRSTSTRGSLKPTSSLWDDAANQKELPVTEKHPNRVDSVEDFLALAERGQATLSDANRFLWTTRKELEPLPLPERREKAAKAGAGRILLWIWNNRETFPLRRIDPSFATMMAWFLHAEGLEEFIWNWIILEAQNMQSLGMIDRSGGGHHPLQWCQRLLAGLVEADFSWSKDESADAAILRFLRAVEHFGPHSRYPYTVGLGASGVCIERIVTSKHGRPTCSAALFERLVDEVHNWRSYCFKPALGRANLLLYHPTKADGTPWFDIIYDVYNGQKSFDKGPYREIRRTRKFWCKNSLRAAHILRIKGDNHKAAYLESIVQQHFQNACARREKFLAQFKDDVRLQRLMHDP